MKKFRKRVLEAISSCDTDIFDTAWAEHCAQTVQEIGEEALKLGLPDAYKRCCVGDMLSPRAAKAILGEVLAEIDRNGQSEEKPPAPADAPLTVKQAAEFLNVSPKTIYAACEAGTLRHLRIGEGRGTIRITKTDLESFRRQNQTDSKPLIKDYLS
ncbi:helix-turn-helix domain-containing protein [Blastopirellula marina]|nr:helix-turn-helix domain-containing protein [Blastopirellula marina]